MKRELPSECGGCGLEERWFLHHVCIRQTYRRLCTSCVLKLHSGSFCPICFEVYEGSRLPDNRVMCSRCPSVTHPDCVSKDVASSFVCPPCSNPNFTFFEREEKTGRIDEEMGKVLVAAAQIAFISMSKAANCVKVEADRKVKEASLKRKEAREALDRIYYLTSKEKKKGKETMVVAKAPIAVAKIEEKKIFKGNKALSVAVMAHHRFGSDEAILKSGRGAVPSNSFPSVGNRDKVEHPKLNAKISGNSQQVQNNFVLQEKEKNCLYSIPADSGKLQQPQNALDMKAHGNSKACLDSEMGRQIPQPNQDSLVSSEGNQLGSSKMAS